MIIDPAYFIFFTVVRRFKLFCPEFCELNGIKFKLMFITSRGSALRSASASFALKHEIKYKRYTKLRIRPTILVMYLQIFQKIRKLIFNISV